MRIALTGTHKVGKTTLAEEIAEYLPGYEWVSEPYLQLEERGYLFREEPTADDYIEQFHYAVKQIGNSTDNIIFDRCPFDLLAYIEATGTENQVTALYNRMINAMTQIDLVILVPIETPDRIPCSDSELPELRQTVDEILHNWIDDLDCTVVEVNGTIANRKAQIIENIRLSQEH